MLRSCPKGETSGATSLTLEEDRLLRAAFGRYGGETAARVAAAAVVAYHQQQGPGRWFVCDCRPDAPCPPVLVPVAQTHIRRHQDAHWPAHAEACDFFRDPAEQRDLLQTYTPAALERPLRLARAFDTAPVALEQTLRPISHGTSRPGLARLLVRLVTVAGFQHIPADWRPPLLVDQVKALWQAARRIELDPGVFLPAFLCTSPGRLPELVERIAAAPATRFVRNRPHGILIARLAAVGPGMIEPVAGAPIPVRGRVAVFGDRAKGVPETKTKRSARAPYLAACLVGRAAADSPVEVLSAYAHPCAGAQHLMLVDSDLERRTFQQLRGLQSWLLHKRGIRVVVDKPLLDLGPSPTEGDTGSSRPPCLPDFVLRARPVPGDGSAVVIVETMGYADADYRERKLRTHRAMLEALPRAPIVTHDFCEPAGEPQHRRDERFRCELRLTITGPECQAARQATDAAMSP